MKGWLVPAVTLAVAGVTAIERSVAWFTVTVVDPLIPDRVAVTMVLPTFVPVTSPAVVAELPTVAIELSATVQVAEVVTSWVNCEDGSPATP